MQRYVVNFAKTGNSHDPELPPWPPFDEGKPSVMHFAERPLLGEVPGLDRLQFLDGILRAQQL